MRLITLLIGFCLVASLAFADVTAEIVAKDIDDNGNIRIWTCHKIDGVEVESRYPKINGHFVYATRYSKQNFKDYKNKTEIETHILNDVKNHSNALLQKEFDKNAPKTLRQIRVDYNTTANQAFTDTNLDTLIGKGVSLAETKQQIDTDNDGVLDKELTLRQDGSYIASDIEPIVF